eukprot:scaffold102919_cov13-Tisochrysis_lutea.AAC.1
MACSAGAARCEPGGKPGEAQTEALARMHATDLSKPLTYACKPGGQPGEAQTGAFAQMYAADPILNVRNLGSSVSRKSEQGSSSVHRNSDHMPYAFATLSTGHGC